MIPRWIGLLGCDGEIPPPLDTASAEPQFGVVADGLASGTLLGAWSDGDTLLMVGGTLSLTGPTAGGLARFDGQQVCAEPEAAGATLWWVHGTRPGDWWAVGAEGTVLHEVDGVRTEERLPTPATLYGVWAAEDGRVWAVGGDVRTGLGEIWRWDGAWSPMARDLPGVVFKVWDRWFVGDHVALHLEQDGETLTEHPVPAGARLLTVRGRADDDVWAVGGVVGPVVVHWDGIAWTEVEIDPQCSAQPLNGVWTAPGEPVWVAGNSGAMGSFDGEAWSCAFPPITGEHFHAVWKHHGDVWFVGGNLFDVGDNYGTVAAAGDLGPWSEGCLTD